MPKFLIIQTAFIGDVVLATGIIEKLHIYFPDARIDFLLRKGNETLLSGHPYLHEVLVWDKKKGKLKNLWRLGRRIRLEKYDRVINIQRYAATGFLTVFSGARETIGFDKNPLSRLFTKRIPHIVSATPKAGSGIATARGGKGAGSSLHEIDRNQLLIKDFTDANPARPRLYPTAADEGKVRVFKQGAYITVSPASVWFTKQYPKEKWAAFIRLVPAHYTIYLLGAPSDKELCEYIMRTVAASEETQRPPSLGPDSGFNRRSDMDPSSASPGIDRLITSPGRGVPAVVNLAGQLSFLQSTAIMQDAAMNYVNDSAPMHFASAVNAPVTAVYNSTIPGFGFGPLSDRRFIVEVKEFMDCRPCGLHGYKACPRGHFNCAWKIEDSQLLQTLITSSPEPE